MKKLLPSLSFALVLFAGLSRAQAQSAVAGLDSGVVVQSDTRVPDLAAATNLVFLAEGYTPAERDAFFTDAKTMAKHVDTDGGAAPIRAALRFNFHYVFVPSTDDGAPPEIGGTSGNTPFRMHVDENSMLTTDDAAADAAAVKYAPHVDTVVIVGRFRAAAPGAKTGFIRANSNIKGQGSRVRIPSDSADAFVHELGHALFALGDEYDGRDGPIPAQDMQSLALFPNLTFDSTGARWSQVVAGAVEGGAEWNKGIWHPTATCRMNQCWDLDQTFCPVCQAAMGHMPSAKPDKPAVQAPDKVDSGASVVARIQPGAAGGAWSYYVAVEDVDHAYKEVFVTRVEPQSGTVALGTLPSGHYTVGVVASNPQGDSSWSWTDVTVKGGPGNPNAPPPAHVPYPVNDQGEYSGNGASVPPRPDRDGFVEVLQRGTD
jgi:hypothetical protein